MSAGDTSLWTTGRSRKNRRKEVGYDMGSVERMKNLTPVRAIREFCIECAGSQKAPRKCDNETCPLFVFRLGKNPGRAGIGGRGKGKDFSNSSRQNLRKKGIVEACSG